MTRPARHVVAVGSGKGGVGKSTVALNVALALAERDLEVGILDADVHGPNIPLLLGLARTVPTKHWMLWRNPAHGAHRLEPIREHGIAVMSSGFIVAEEQTLDWDANLISMLVRQLVYETDWGALDVLMVDLPPGTGSIPQQIVTTVSPDGALLVVTPQDVAHLDARKALGMFSRAGVRLLGAVENMSGLSCPHCGGTVQVFRPVREDRSIWSAGIAKLAAVPLDPAISLSGDAGRPVVVDRPDTAQAWAFRTVADRLLERLDA